MRNFNLEDLIFENRNKEYGAYVLRKEYSDNMMKGMFTSFSIMFVIFVLPKLFVNSPIEADKITPVDLGGIILEEIISPPLTIVPPPPAQVPAGEKIKQVAFVDPKVVENIENTETKPPTQEVLSTAVIGTNNSDGKDATVADISPNENKDNKNVGTAIVESDNNIIKEANDEIIDFASEKPEFPGGHSAMFKYFQNNVRYPSIAREEGMEGTVVLRFTVTKKGQIKDIKIVRSVAGGCDEEAIRVVKDMPSWKPGKHNGQFVNVAYNLPIKFKLSR